MRLQLELESLRPLSALRHLKLQHCGVYDIPAAVAAVGQHLRILDVSQNGNFELTAEATDMLLGMPQLRTLLMRKSPREAPDATCT